MPIARLLLQIATIITAGSFSIEISCLTLVQQAGEHPMVVAVEAERQPGHHAELIIAPYFSQRRS